MLNVGGERIARVVPNNLITTHGNTSDRSLFLTFDDGPNEYFTIPICELLAKYHAKATFFCIGNNIKNSPDIARYLVDNGHMLGNHSYKHHAFYRLSLKDQLDEAKVCQLQIDAIDPGTTRIFRAPQGKLSVSTLIFLKLKGWKIVHWSYDTKDYLQHQLDEQLSIINSKPVQNGDIILFHDDSELALKLLEVCLPKWSKMGFHFKTVAELVI